MNRLVGMYIRVSSEGQGDGDKVSPEEQERDIRERIIGNSDVLVDTYADTKRYRVGKRLVEPSGSRSDRPELKRLLADLRAGRINVIYAWRHDRLYRSYRAMLDVLETIEETKADIELVKETFDQRIAPVMAWAAKIELDAKHDRLILGVGGRYRKGKDWNQAPLYGLDRIDGYYVENPVEASAVRFIWDRFGQGDSLSVIRQRLIDIGAPQRKCKIPWGKGRIYQIVSQPAYYTGQLTRRWGDETFTLDVPVLVSGVVAELVLYRKAQYKAYPAGNLKAEALAPGLVHCAVCKRQMSLRQSHCRGYTYIRYTCNNYNEHMHHAGCARQARAEIIDARIWEKVLRLAQHPEMLDSAIEEEIAELQAQSVDADTQITRLERDLDDLLLERQRAIALATKKIITENDLETQLAAKSWQEASTRSELGKLRALSSADQIAALRAVSDEFRQAVSIGDSLLNIPEDDLDDEQYAEVFTFKKHIVQAVVRRVDVDADHQVEVHFVFQLTNSQSACYRYTDALKIELVL